MRPLTGSPIPKLLNLKSQSRRKRKYWLRQRNAGKISMIRLSLMFRDMESRW